ncbi:DUF456 family protein [Desulfobulbus sp. F5]|nr:DUF456 family protein [Desulfobulbus sp. F5]
MVQPLLEWFHSLYAATFANTHCWAFLAAMPFIAAGFAGIVFPALPGTILIAGGFLVYGLITGFDSLSIWFFVGQGVLICLGYAIDLLATAWGVRKFGGSKAAAWGAALGSLMVFVIGPLGILVGPLLGAIVGELIMGEQIKQALHSGVGSFLGFIGGVAAKMFIAGIMVAWFVFQIM